MKEQRVSGIKGLGWIHGYDPQNIKTEYMALNEPVHLVQEGFVSGPFLGHQQL